MSSLITRVVRIRRVAAAYREHAKIIERLREELYKYQTTTHRRGPWKTDWAQDFLVRHKKWLGSFLDDRDAVVEEYLQSHMNLSASDFRKVWKTVKENKVEYDIVEHGLVHPQYFRGHGLSGTYWQDAATGAGDTPYQALDDALEQLASNGWNVDDIRNTLSDDDDNSASMIAQQELVYEGLSEEDIEDWMDSSEYALWFVSVDIRQPDPPEEIKRRYRR